MCVRGKHIIGLWGMRMCVCVSDEHVMVCVYMCVCVCQARHWALG